MKLATLALVGLSVAAQAQQVSFLGKVEDVSGTTNQFVVDCTDTALTSQTLDLNFFVGTQVEINGLWNGSFASPSVEVQAIQPVTETFEIGGGAKIGDTSNLGFTGAAGDTAVGFLSTASGFLPLDSSSVLFVDPTQIRLSASGVIGGSGILELPFTIPNNTALIGVEIYGQGAFLTQAGATVVTNPDCKEISD